MSDKTNYVVHYKNLQLYLSLGMKLTKIHTVLNLNNLIGWTFISILTLKIENAAASFEAKFFKVMVNSVYGKTIENLRKRISVKVVNNEKDFLKHVSKSTYISQKIFDKNYAAIHEIKPVLTHNKPIYVGFTVLEFR